MFPVRFVRESVAIGGVLAGTVSPGTGEWEGVDVSEFLGAPVGEGAGARGGTGER